MTHQPQPQKLSERFSFAVIVATLTSVSSFIGVLRTLTAETTGASFQPGELLFYIGASVMAVYVAVGAGAMFGAGGVMLVASAFGGDDSKAAESLALGAAAVLAAAVLWGLIQAGVLWDYEDTDTMGRVFSSLIALGAIALPFYLHHRRKAQED